MSLQLLRRNHLQQELLKRIQNWKDPAVKSSYVIQPNNPVVDDFGIERDDNGYYFLSDNVFSYCDLRSGMIYRIKKNYNNNDWKCYSELYQSGVDSGKFRLDIPLHREEVYLEERNWEYVELQSPNRDYGYNFNDDVFSWPELTDGLTPNAGIDSSYKNTVKEYFKEYIDQSLDLVTAAVAVSAKNGTGMPKGICEPSNRYKDAVGYFWSDFDHEDWNLSKNEIKIVSMEVFGASIMFAKVCGVLDQTHVSELIDYARSKWTTI